MELSSDTLDKFRLQCDPLADDAIDAVADKLGKDALKTHNPLRSVEKLAEQGCIECSRYLQFYEQSPYWFNDSEDGTSRFDAGRKFFVRNVVFSGLVLMYGSLVMSFTSTNGNKVLMATGQLYSNYRDVRFRIFETLSFVKAVMLSKMQELKRKCCRVRLLHSMVRYHIRHGVKWDVAKYGEPINQEDMAGTLLAFSMFVIEGLVKLGISGSRDEIESYLQLWRYVGYYLGTHKDLMCCDAEHALDTLKVIQARQLIPDDDSHALIQTLLHAFEGQPPFFLSYSLSSQISRHLVGEEFDLVDQLGLQKTTWSTKLLLKFIYSTNKAVTVAQHYVPLFANLLYKLGRHFLCGLVHHSLQGREPSYMLKIMPDKDSLK